MRPQHTAVALLLSLFAVPASAAISGAVMTTDGQPVAGARVTLHAPEAPEARRARLVSATPERVPLATAQTDARGSFSLQSPKEPVVDLRVDARGYDPEVRRVEREEDAGAIALVKREMKTGAITAGGKPVLGATVVISYGGTDFTVRTDDRGRYEAPEPKRARSITVLHPDYAIDEENFQSPNTPASELNRTLVAGTSISGLAVAGDGKTPIAKATITIDMWPLATTGDEGTFTIAHVPSKWMSLAASKDTLAAQRTFTADKSVTLRLQKLGTVTGRVLDSKAKVPVAGATVNLFTRRFMISGQASAITDAKGAYAVHVAAGSFNIMVTHPGFDSQNADVTVAAGQQALKDLAVTPLARVSGVVIDEDKRPVVAAVITADADMRMGMPPMRLMRGGGTGTTISGPDGRFSIRIPTDSELRMRAVKKGLPPAKGDSLRLGPGERKSGIVLTIPTGIAVTGVVKDASGDPLSGVAVTATETPSGSGGMMMRRMSMRGFMGEEEDAVRTASDGTFTLRVREGTYDFAFRREGFAPREVRAQNITSAGGTAIETTLEPAVEISGRVTRGGVGVPDVMINAFTDNVNAMSGPDGSFTLGGLSAGPVRVMLFKDADLVQEQRSLTAPARDVVIDLPAGGTIRGRVVEKGSRKPITSFEAGVSTSASGGGMVRMSPPMLRNFTSEDGSFTLKHVAPGAMTLVANAPGYAAGRMNVDVQEGKTINDVVVELETGVRLVGKITGANGAPLSDASVSVMPSATGSFARGGSLRRTTTDANGEYTLDSLDAGEETINITHPKHTNATRTVTLKGGETRLDVQLEGGQRVTGVVVTESGMPVAEAEVRALSASGSGRSARTDGSGAFELESLAAGRYRFTATKSGYTEAKVEDVDISSGTPVRLVVGVGGTISGRVIGLPEKDYANTTVNAFGRSMASAAVDPTGNFRIEGAPLGTVSVQATVSSAGSFSDRRTSATLTVEVEPGSSQQVTLEFRGDTVIRGRVTRNGTPFGGATVSFYARSRAQASVSADQQGLYSASGLEPGEYSVTVGDGQRFSMYTTTYNVRGSDTFDIDFKAGSVRGRVVDAATNDPIADATVQFRTAAVRQSGALRSALTDPSGAFILELVPPGAYVVTASGEGYGNQVLDVTIAESGREGLELKLARNDGATLRVVDGRDGRALSAMVTVYDAQGRVVHDNRMMFGGGGATDVRVPVGPGSYVAAVTASGYAPRSVSFTSPSTQTVPLTPGGTIVVQSKHSTRRRIRLIDATGSAYPRFGQRPYSYELPPGTLPIDNVATGVYTLQLLSDDESVAATQQVVVREGETVRVEI